MDYQNRVGHKLGSGAPATWQVREGSGRTPQGLACRIYRQLSAFRRPSKTPQSQKYLDTNSISGRKNRDKGRRIKSASSSCYWGSKSRSNSYSLCNTKRRPHKPGPIVHVLLEGMEAWRRGYIHLKRMFLFLRL